MRKIKSIQTGDKGDLKLSKKINKLRVENDLLRERLKQVSLAMDDLLQNQIHKDNGKTEKDQAKEKKQARKIYLQALTAQLKISEKMIDQLLHEKARLRLRQEQLSNQGYLPDLVKSVESLDVQIGEQRSVNKRLNTTSKQKGEEIVKSQSGVSMVVPAEKERQIKLISEELQRQQWKIAEREKYMSVLEEKELGFMIKTTNVKQKYDDLKKAIEGNGGQSPKKVINAQQFNKRDDIQNGGEVADAMELDALHKKLLVEQWSRESKKNYLDQQIKINQKFIEELEGEIQQKIVLLSQKQQKVLAVNAELNSLEQKKMYSTVQKKYGFLTSQSFQNSPKSRTSHIRLAASAEKFKNLDFSKHRNSLPSLIQPLIQAQPKTTLENIITNKPILFQMDPVENQQQSSINEVEQQTPQIQIHSQSKTNIADYQKQHHSFQVSEIAIDSHEPHYQSVNEDNSILDD